MIKIKLLIFCILFFSFINLTADNIRPTKLSWDQWKKNLISELKKTGEYEEKTIKNLETIKYNNKVILLDRRQPEYKLSLKEYFDKVIPQSTVSKGKKQRQNIKENLNQISKKYNVDSNILVALWGIESRYGTNLGKFDILSSLASLSYEGRRKEFFLNQLMTTLRIIEDNDLTREYLKGSWAGAFGQTQFMPTTYQYYAVDFNNDGIKDLKNTSDALASGANYLNKLGWKYSLEWGEEFFTQRKIIKDLKTKKCKPLDFWLDLGFKPVKNYSSDTCFRILVPEKNKEKYFLVTSNFDLILKWNRSNFFALAVGTLSDKISGK